MGQEDPLSWLFGGEGKAAVHQAFRTGFRNVQYLSLGDDVSSGTSSQERTKALRMMNRKLDGLLKV